MLKKNTWPPSLSNNSHWEILLSFFQPKFFLQTSLLSFTDWGLCGAGRIRDLPWSWIKWPCAEPCDSTKGHFFRLTEFRDYCRSSLFTSSSREENSEMLRKQLFQLANARLGFLPAIQSYRNQISLSCRAYSTNHSTGAPLTATSLTIEQTDSPNPLTPAEQLVFGRTFTGRVWIGCSDVGRSYVDSWMDCCQRMVCC